MRLMAKGGPDGNVAIYSGSNDTPFTDPVGNLSRVKFHTGLDYIVIVGVRTGTLSLPQRARGARYLDTHLGPTHGRPGIPVVFGYITLGGVDIALAGSMPVNSQASINNSGTRLLALGANSSRILFHEQTFVSDFNSVMAAQSIPYTVFITDESL